MCSSDLVWIPSRHRLEWPKGQVAYAFSAEDPESLRGPQFAAAWCDELAKWKRAEDTYFGARFGVLGVYVTGRTREKEALATGELAQGPVARMVKALVKKK